MADHQPFAGMAQDETLVDVSTLISLLANILGAFSPDGAGRLRVNAEVLANIATVTTVTTVTTVGNVANQTLIGGMSAVPHILAMTQMSEGDLIRRI